VNSCRRGPRGRTGRATSIEGSCRGGCATLRPDGLVRSAAAAAVCRGEDLLRHLKRVSLSDSQVARLRRLILELCELEGWGRELRNLTRLMIPFADTALLEDLRALGSQDAARIRARVDRTVGALLNSRPDLR